MGRKSFTMTGISLDEAVAAALQESGGLPRPGETVVVSYYHDDGCPALESSRNADCDCDVEVVLDRISR